jgi:hypothetical protein
VDILVLAPFTPLTRAVSFGGRPETGLVARAAAPPPSRGEYGDDKSRGRYVLFNSAQPNLRDSRGWNLILWRANNQPIGHTFLRHHNNPLPPTSGQFADPAKIQFPNKESNFLSVIRSAGLGAAVLAKALVIQSSAPKVD